MTAEQLRNSILQEAISGRLVPQDPNDEPASVLLARIREEKARLVKEGKLKKKDLVETPITDEEKPFEIPSSWEWVRVKELFNVCSARRVHEKDWRSSGIPFYRAREIGKLAEFGHVDNDLYIDQELYNEFSKSGVPQENDLMVTAVGTLGRVYVVKANEIFYYKDGSVLCMENRFGINAKFAKLVIESPAFVSQYIGESQGTTVATLTMVRMNEYLIPLPPLAEQKRIVAKLEELLPIVEQYGKAQKELDELNAALPTRLRQSILQEAISGRLVPQDPNDEPAEKLLNRLELEKKDLVAHKILKKQELDNYELKDQPEDIPAGWKFVKLRKICTLLDGEKKSGKYICMDAKFLRGKSQGAYLESGKFVSEGENVILVDGENSGEIFVAPIDGYMGSTFKQLWISKEMYTPYVEYLIKSFKETLRNDKKGAAIPHLKKELFFNLPVGVPPLAEQQRIVAKIEELFAEIDKLK